LRQMQQLQLHPSATFHVDATPAPEQLCRRVHSLLSKRAFHVDTGNFEGMNFAGGQSPLLAATEGNAFAQKLKLQHYSLDASGLKRLHRMKTIIDFHPTIVNSTLTPADQSHYF